MPRIMIVDDELLSRMGMSTMLAKYSGEFQITAEVDNVTDALAIAKRDKPDVIITDIKMPTATGIDLIRSAKEEGLQCKFIILSAYSEFNDVKEGMKLGAEDYILKLDLEEDKLISLLRNMTKKSVIQTAHYTSSYSELSYNSHLEQQHLIYQLLTEQVPVDVFADKLSATGFSLSKRDLSCLLVWSEPEGIFSQDPSSTQQIFSLLESFLKNYGIGCGCIIEPNIFCFLICLKRPDAETGSPPHKSLAITLTEYMKNSLNVKLYAIASPSTDKYEDIIRFFNLNCHRENGNFLMTNPTQKTKNEMQYLFEEELSEINNSLKSKLITKLPDAFEALQESILKRPDISIKNLHSICDSLVHIIGDFSECNQYLNLNWNRSAEFLYLIQECNTKEDYITYINKLYKKLMELNFESNEDMVITRAKDYISQNFTRDLPLTEVAEFVNLNPYYFSRIFSRKTKTNFVMYINNLRVDQAKKMLQSTNLKIQEISTQIGYNSSFYFIKTFKKMTSMTPNEYRSISRIHK